MERLRATLLQIGVVETVFAEGIQETVFSKIPITGALHHVTADEARGFFADVLVLSRKPVTAEEADDYIVFIECLAHSLIRTIYITEN